MILRSFANINNIIDFLELLLSRYNTYFHPVQLYISLSCHWDNILYYFPRWPVTIATALIVVNSFNGIGNEEIKACIRWGIKI